MSPPALPWQELGLLHPQLLELASLTSGSLWLVHIASAISELLTDTKLAIGNGGLGTAWHAFHVKKCPLPEIKTKAPHLGKYFLKEPQMGKFAP